jgi:hypothetical protein
MKLPRGISEQQLLDIIERVVNRLSSMFSFGYFDMEDIKQQARLMALEALPKFKKGRGNQELPIERRLEAFFTTHIRNRLNNLRRDKLFRNQPPCCNCDYYTNDGCNCYSRRNDCTKYDKWFIRNEAKRGIMEPSDISISPENSYEDVQEQTILRDELIRIINIKLPANLRSDYLRLLDGQSLTKANRLKLFDIIKDILKDYGI